MFRSKDFLDFIKKCILCYKVQTLKNNSHDQIIRVIDMGYWKKTGRIMEYEANYI